MIVSRYNDYYEDEKLYSTGDYKLDELLERAFCEGYEYAQKGFISTMRLKSPSQISDSIAHLLDKKYGPNHKVTDESLTDARNLLRKNTTDSVKKHKDYMKLVQNSSTYGDGGNSPEHLITVNKEGYKWRDLKNKARNSVLERINLDRFDRRWGIKNPKTVKNENR